MNAIELCIFERHIRVECADQWAKFLLTANYGSFQTQTKEPHLHYRIGPASNRRGFTIHRDGSDPLVARDDGEFLFLLEKDMTIELQKRRRDLYFLHSAAVEFGGRAFLFVAPSGGGKSTTTWGNLQQGFRYMSDELAPVGLEKMEIHSYPRALCLKSEPQYPYLLPDRTVYTSRTIHVPAECLPGAVRRDPIPSLAIFFLRWGSPSGAPFVKPMSKAEAAARLFANALNPLAHKGEGLDAAIAIARRNACFELALADLSATCSLVKRTLEGLCN